MTDKVHIGGLIFDGEGESSWVYSDLKGWYSSAPMRAVIEERPNGDGAFGVTKNYRAPRVLTFEGSLLGSSFAQAQTELWDAFASIQSDGAPFRLAVETDAGTRACVVTLTGSAEVRESKRRNVATVTAQFVALDPVKYGPSRSVLTGLPSAGGGLEYELGEPDRALSYGVLGDLGRVTLTNAGTAEVWPSFEVSGELTAGFFVQNLASGATLRYDRVVPSGSTVFLDSRTGEVLVDRVSDGSTYLTRNEWFPVGPGESVTVQFNAVGGSSGGPMMAAAIADGFW